MKVVTMSLEGTVERCREGDEAAWSALVGQTIKPLFRLASSYCRSRGEAEELTQEIFLKLWQNLDNYKAGTSFMAWAWRVGRNLLIDAHRRRWRERDATWLDPEVLERVSNDDDPYREAERRQRLELIGQSLGRLDEELSQLIILRDFADFSYQEVAEALDLPIGTVKSRLNRARLQLADDVRRRARLGLVEEASG